VERAGKKDCGRDAAGAGDGGPKRLFLNGVEDEPGTRRMLEQAALDEAVEVKNLRSGPCGEILALAGAMEVRRDGTGARSLAATTRPPRASHGVDFLFGPHSSVYARGLRKWGWGSYGARRIGAC